MLANLLSRNTNVKQGNEALPIARTLKALKDKRGESEVTPIRIMDFGRRWGMRRGTNVGFFHIESRRERGRIETRKKRSRRGGNISAYDVKTQNERSSNKVGHQRASGTKSKSQTVGSEGIRVEEGGEGTRL